ncbi:hypothetical protein PHMEG_00028353 [Phytophthora megakarya]|uniref:Uncharacterized protein n=1 Tax=Phytophthora megakarya TaxID=4795 RepID=A0A225V554_9STRA|nr:hypothetical protein PHMEG_00028353 [Phytophthora megakarya]
MSPVRRQGERGADLEVSWVEGRVSDSSPPGQDLLSELQSEVQVELPSPVPEEKPVEAEVEPTLEEKLQLELEPSSESEWRLESNRQAYTASQVSRWEQKRSEHVFPLKWNSPDHETTWTLLPGVTRRWQRRLHDLAPDCWDLGTTQALIGVHVPTELITPRVCVAILETMLYKAGFRFRNLVPAWFHAHAAKVAPEVSPSLLANAQRLRTTELVAW